MQGKEADLFFPKLLVIVPTIYRLSLIRPEERQTCLIPVVRYVIRMFRFVAYNRHFDKDLKHGYGKEMRLCWDGN
jgi:hypothetical protein